MPVSEKTYRQLALEDPNGHWELHHGELRQKDGMSFEHNNVLVRLFQQLALQLDEREFVVRPNLGHVRRSSESYYIPDIYVVRAELVREGRERRPNRLEVYESPLPLVVEVWSPSTGRFDVDSKLPEYQQRGDFAIWRIHPFEHTLTAWRRQPGGDYAQMVQTGGKVQRVMLPGVTVDLDALFA